MYMREKMTGSEWLGVIIVLTIIGWLIPPTIPFLVIGYFIAVFLQH